jgi:hypothetical protein
MNIARKKAATELHEGVSWFFFGITFETVLEKKGAPAEEEASVEWTQSRERLSFHLRLGHSHEACRIGFVNVHASKSGGGREVFEEIRGIVAR